MKKALVTLIVLALLAAVTYLAGTINHNRYRLVQQDEQVMVERGTMLPFGFARFEPQNLALQAAYAPVPLPEGVVLQAEEVYTERGDLDRAIFALLSAWAQSRLTVGGEQNLEMASLYLERALLLPALSEDLRTELRRLRGQVAWRAALTRIEGIGVAINKARSELQLALQSGVAEASLVSGLLEGLLQIEAEQAPLLSMVGSANRLGALPERAAETPNNEQAAAPDALKDDE